MLDPQRNLLTVILVGLLALLGAVALVMMMFLGRVDLDRIPSSSGTGVDEVQVDVPETGLAAFDEYTMIMERPVFFSDRRLPVVEMADEGSADEADLDEIEPVEEVSELRAGIAGIVITPEMKLAMVRDDAAGKTMVLREGMSLEGEQAAWMLERILPREVSFVSVDGRRTDLELKVHTSGLTVETPRPTSRRQQQAQQEAETPTEPVAEQEAEQASDEARARAEEIRRRVAERRAELRAEAERRAQQQRRQDNNG